MTYCVFKEYVVSTVLEFEEPTIESSITNM